MAVIQSDYQQYLQGELLHDRYLRVKSLNEGSFGIVSIAKDTKDNDKLVAVKYNTGRLGDFAAYNNEPETNLDVRSVSLNSKTKSVIRSNATYSNTQHSDKDVSKSIVLRETKQEILMLKKVDNHPNITKLLDSFDTFMILEYAPRGDLHDAIQLGIAPVATRDVIDVFMQLISAVEYCHKLGVYHRDIKPENILISEDWSIKLTDFGLATEKLICTDFDVGSERYMAPELLEHSDIDSYAADKVDIWALGVCLLNIVFGKSPFRSASSKDKMFLHFAANRETLFDIFPFMSYDLFSVMIHSLTIDPANRDLEMIKENLLNADVLTYDYEFEEDIDDDKGIINSDEPIKHDIKADALIEEIGEDEPQVNDNIMNKDLLADKENNESLLNTINKNENTATILDSNKNLNDSSIESNLVISKKPTDSNYKTKSLLQPKIHISPDYSVNSIDNIMESNNDSKLNVHSYSAVKPIPIPKRYEPPHKLSINKSNTSKNNNNSGKKNNFRARRWNAVHRKPLKIANYNYRNKSQEGRIRGRNSFKEDTFDFNRKDFFTPKSVFSHYMEKANRGKQQLQQRGTYYRKNRDYENNSNNYNHSNRMNNNINNYSNSTYCDRRAWQKRKRRFSHAPNNFNGGNKNRDSYKSNNNKFKNSGIDSSSWRQKHDQNSFMQRRMSNNNATFQNSFLESHRASIDGKYIPPNLRFNSASLMGSAVASDDEFEMDNDRDADENTSDETSPYDNADNNDIFEEDEFSFEFEHPVLSANKNRGNSATHNNSNNNTQKSNFHQIESNAINLLSRQFAESKIFDDRSNSRNTSLTTTISNNFSSTGSNINGSPKGYKKYIPPHNRRNSHSATETPTSNIESKKLNNHILLNHFIDGIIDKSILPVSTSAPTKSTSFFQPTGKPIAPHDLLTTTRFEDFANEDFESQFEIGQGIKSSKYYLNNSITDKKHSINNSNKNRNSHNNNFRVALDIYSKEH